MVRPDWWQVLATVQTITIARQWFRLGRLQDQARTHRAMVDEVATRLTVLEIEERSRQTQWTDQSY